MGSKSQRKGRAGELELARLLQGYGYDVQPGQAVSYGATPDLVGLPHIHIECKPRPSGTRSGFRMERPPCSIGVTAPAGW